MDSHGCSQPKILNLKPFLSRPWCGLFGILHIQIQDVPRRSICFYWSPSEYGTGSTPTGPPLRSMHPRHPKCEPQKLTTTKACREPEIQRKLRGIIKTYQNVKWWSLQMMIISIAMEITICFGFRYFFPNTNQVQYAREVSAKATAHRLDPISTSLQSNAGQGP